MNWKSLVSAAISLAALSLVFSCTTKDRGITIRNPTVADMQRLEAEWGLPPKPVSTGTSSTTATSVPATAGGAQTVTTTSTTSTTTEPAETPPAITPPAVPPSLR